MSKKIYLINSSHIPHGFEALRARDNIIPYKWILLIKRRKKNCSRKSGSKPNSDSSL